jgi:hypothetical protein
MKIAMLYASWEKFGETWSTPMSFRAELESRGHEITHFNLYHDEGAFLPGKKIRNYSNQGINQLYTSFSRDIYKPDVIFVMDYGPWDALQFDKQYFPGVKLVKECGDEPQAFNLHRNAMRRLNLMLSPDKLCVECYRKNDSNAVWWTHCADQRIFMPKADIKPIFDCVTTCGPRGKGLTEEVKRALGDQFNNERYFYGQDYVNRLNMGNIVFQMSQYGEVTRRIFEGMACGKMVITDRLAPNTGLADMFVDGQDIVYFDNAQDAIDKIRYFSSHENERDQIAKNGYEKVMANHTVKQRIDVFEKEIGLL